MVDLICTQNKMFTVEAALVTMPKILVEFVIPL